MDILQKRAFRGEAYTIGRLYVNGDYLCDTLEDPVRDLKADGSGKIYGKTAIPAGVYRAKLTNSQRFKRQLPEIMDVPFFTGIRCHSGNTAEDTDGCILVGKNTEKGKLTKSRLYEEKLTARMALAMAGGEPITWTIK